MGLGLTGWLSPDGEFYQCEYGEHSGLASEIMETHEKKSEMARERAKIMGEKGTVVSYDRSLRLMMWIPMGIPKWGSQERMDYLFIHYETGMSKEQEKWFSDNFDKLSVWQQGMLEEHMKDKEFDKKVFGDK